MNELCSSFKSDLIRLRFFSSYSQTTLSISILLSYFHTQTPCEAGNSPVKPGRPLGADPLLQSFWSAAVEQNPHLSATRFPPLSKVSSNYKYFFSELKHGHRAQHTSAKHPENGAPRRGTDFYWRFFHIFTANKQLITLAFLDNLNSAFYISSWFTVAQVSWNPTALNTSAAQHIKVLSVACFCVFDIQP